MGFNRIGTFNSANLSHFSPTDSAEDPLFLEADRSTESHPQFAPTKILAYWYYLETGKVHKKHRIPNFRVVVVTKTDKRAENLAVLVARSLPSKAHKYYLFTSIENFSFENPKPIFKEIYIRPGSSDRYPLVRPPQQP